MQKFNICQRTAVNEAESLGDVCSTVVEVYFQESQQIIYPISSLSNLIFCNADKSVLTRFLSQQANCLGSLTWNLITFMTFDMICVDQRNKKKRKMFFSRNFSRTKLRNY